jgi:hypothetical protein
MFDENDDPNPDRLIDLPGVLRRVPVGRSTIFSGARKALFPLAERWVPAAACGLSAKSIGSLQAVTRPF